MRFTALAVLLLAGALAKAAPAGPPVAFVADIRGNVTIEGDGKLMFLAELAAGTRLLLGSNAAVSITYAATGAEFTAKGPGEFLVTGAEVKAEKGAAPQKRTVMSLKDGAVVARLSQAATASVRMRGFAPAQRSSLQFPVDTRVSSLRPAPRWTGETAGPYTVTLTDATGKEIWKGDAKSDTQIPVKLSAATRYRWTVMTASGALGEAQFETAPADAVARAEKARAAARSFSDRVVHAVVLQEIGASQEAREAWAALARERPDLPELAALAR
jgi:hypothetical protein